MSQQQPTKRVLAAPFQPKGGPDSAHARKAEATEVLFPEYVDYRSHQFTPLEDLKHVEFDTVSSEMN